MRSRGDGNSTVGCQWTYGHHKKSVFSVSFLESSSLAGRYKMPIRDYYELKALIQLHFAPPKVPANAPVNAFLKETSYFGNIWCTFYTTFAWVVRQWEDILKI